MKRIAWLSIAFVSIALAVALWLRSAAPDEPAPIAPPATAVPDAAPTTPAPTAAPPGARAPDPPPAFVAPERWATPAQRALLFDPDASLTLRRNATAALGRDGSREACDALLSVIDSDAPILLVADAGRALAGCEEPRAFDRMVALLDHDEPRVADGALRGLALSHDPRAVEFIRAVLTDDRGDAQRRVAAARALATRGDPAAGALLRDVFESTRDPGFAASLLGAIAELPFVQTEAIFRDLLLDTRGSEALRLEALEALGSSRHADPAFLAEVMGQARSAELRSAAVDGLARAPGAAAAPLLLAGLEKERSPQVRAGIYRGLRARRGDAIGLVDFGDLVRSAAGESSPEARAEGALLAAWVVRERDDPDLARRFDDQLAIQLAQAALSSEIRAVRRSSIEALRVASTPGSRDALRRIAGSGDPGLAAAAQRALDEAR